MREPFEGLDRAAGQPREALGSAAERERARRGVAFREVVVEPCLSGCHPKARNPGKSGISGIGARA